MLEKEIKIMLTKEEFEKMKAVIRPEKVITQVNHYYFSKECGKKRISVRVRETGGKCLLQVKLPVSDDGALAVREEIERELPAVPDEIGNSQLKEICGVDAAARRIGSLATERFLSYRFKDVELCLDRNEYLGFTDYELEAEYTGEYPEEVITLLKSEGIDTERPAKGKYSRFLERVSSGEKIRGNY